MILDCCDPLAGTHADVLHQKEEKGKLLKTDRGGLLARAHTSSNVTSKPDEERYVSSSAKNTLDAASSVVELDHPCHPQ